MTNRIGGDYSAEALEQFRAAYAQQLSSPEQDEIANNSGLPTDTVANTSPWIATTGLWKYPSGKGPDDDLKVAFNPDEYISEDEYEEEEDLTDDDDDDSPRMTDEEIESLIQELLYEDEEEVED